MYKRLILLILLFSIFVSPIHAGDIPSGVKPVQVTAVSDPIFDGAVQYILTFWNVGQLSDDPSHHEVVISGKCLQQETSGGWQCTADKPENNQKGTFSGGPNGTFSINSRTFSLVNGTKGTVSADGAEMTYTVQNPEAFAGWSQSQKTEESSNDDGEIKASEIKGDVNYSKDGKTWEKFETTTQIKIQESIRTGPRSHTILTYPDGSVFKIKPNSEITILTDGLLIHSGDVWFKVKKVGRTFQVFTEETVVSVLGTTFTVSVIGDITTLKLLEGSVAFKSKASGITETVNPGEMMTSDKNGLGQKATFDVNAENAAWNEVEKKTSESDSPITKIVNAFLALWRWVSTLLSTK